MRDRLRIIGTVLLKESSDWCNGLCKKIVDYLHFVLRLLRIKHYDKCNFDAMLYPLSKVLHGYSNDVFAVPMIVSCFVQKYQVMCRRCAMVNSVTSRLVLAISILFALLWGWTIDVGMYESSLMVGISNVAVTIAASSIAFLLMTKRICSAYCLEVLTLISWPILLYMTHIVWDVYFCHVPRMLHYSDSVVTLCFLPRKFHMQFSFSIFESRYWK